jgi:glycosyltransferase involved in cell wall biosynthesis
MPSRLPISVYFVSGAEARRIGTALESVSGWASEIIVLLNHDVADGTGEIALRHGAKVFREPWKGFVGQKASAMAKTGQPWTLNLDADEVVSPALHDEIARVIETAAADVGAFSIPSFWAAGSGMATGIPIV